MDVVLIVSQHSLREFHCMKFYLYNILISETSEKKNTNTHVQRKQKEKKKTKKMKIVKQKISLSMRNVDDAVGEGHQTTATTTKSFRNHSV